MYDSEIQSENPRVLMIEAKIESSLATFRKNIRFLRKKASKMTLEDSAIELGISRDTLFKLERGSNRAPNIRTVLKICYYYKLSINDIFSTDLEYEEIRSVNSLPVLRKAGG